MANTLVVTDGAVQLQACTLYAHACAVLNDHHVVPKSWWLNAGKAVASPMRLLCPNCHYDTHAAIDGLIKGQNVSSLPPRCVKLARTALTLAAESGLTPALTL